MHIQILNYILRSKYKTFLLISTTGILYYVLNFVWPIPTLTLLGGGKIIPDLLPFGASYEYIYSLFTELGTNGRDQYLLFLYTLDVIFPISYSLFFGMLLWLSIRDTNINENIKYILISFSFIAACFDYIENISTILLIHSFPKMNVLIVNMGSIATIFKNLFSFIGMSLIIGFTLYNLYRFYLQK